MRRRTHYADVRPEDGLRNGLGYLTPNRGRIRDSDPDLVGTLRVDGRVIRVRGWIVEAEAGAGIRLAAAQEPA